MRVKIRKFVNKRQNVNIEKARATFGDISPDKMEINSVNLMRPKKKDVTSFVEKKHVKFGKGKGVDLIGLLDKTH